MVTVKQDDDRKKDNRIQVSLHENLHEKVISGHCLKCTVNFYLKFFLKYFGEIWSLHLVCLA